MPATSRDRTHATAHCSNTMIAAHLRPSSLRMDATAATQGVYRRQNTKSARAVAGDRTAVTAADPPYRIMSVDTTLSFAINPVINAVTTRHSPKPCSANTGARIPARPARMLSFEFSTMLKPKSKVCKNHTKRLAMKITVNALCRKSFALSHRSIPTLLRPGNR